MEAATVPTDERIADVGDGVEICWQQFGSDTDPALVLVMGLGVQMLGWHEDFCAMLAGRGYRVIRFDNRDVGLSTHFSEHRPNINASMLGFHGRAPYRLTDMARDTVGLLDHLEIDSAHLVGASMGGMISQTVAAHHPGRVRSLTSIMSGPGGRHPRHMPTLKALKTLLTPPPREREALVEHFTRTFRVIGSPHYPAAEEDLRERILGSHDRNSDPHGVGRQLMAVMASGNRVRELRRISAPTLVIHGTHDPLVRPFSGRATAEAIPGARLETIAGMGHDLPRQLWPRFGELIDEHASGAHG